MSPQLFEWGEVWVARDENGILYAFSVKPRYDKVRKAFCIKMGNNFCELPIQMFPTLTFKSSPV